MTDLLTRTQLTGDYIVDTVHSRLGFIARHAMVTKVRGSFRWFTGELHIDGADPSNSRGSIRIDVASIDTGSADRDAHLRTNDFFAVDTYPQITYGSTSVHEVGRHCCVAADRAHEAGQPTDSRTDGAPIQCLHPVVQLRHVA
jgi:polyisoprenoid-binding protein YceI